MVRENVPSRQGSSLETLHSVFLPVQERGRQVSFPAWKPRFQSPFCQALPP